MPAARAFFSYSEVPDFWAQSGEQRSFEFFGNSKRLEEVQCYHMWCIQAVGDLLSVRVNKWQMYRSLEHLSMCSAFLVIKSAVGRLELLMCMLLVCSFLTRAYVTPTIRRYWHRPAHKLPNCV